MDDHSASSLEKIFQQVEEESERRARLQADSDDAGGTLTRKQRRRGSISISRFGQIPEPATDGDSGAPPPTPSRLAMAAAKSPLYGAQSRNPNASHDSFADSDEDEDDGPEEDEHHVTQMEQIAGKQSIGKKLSRRLSRAHGRPPPVTGAGLVIGVSVEEATTEAELAAGHERTRIQSPDAQSTSRTFLGRKSMGNLRTGESGTWAKAKGIFRRKSVLWGKDASDARR